TLVAVNDQSGNEGDTISLQLSATDSHSGTLTYSATGLPLGLSISSSGHITGTLHPGGSFDVTITASDGTYHDWQSFTWAVASPLSINDPGDQTSSEGDVIHLQIAAGNALGGT